MLLTRDMARRGVWRPAVEYLAGQAERQTGIRDYLEGEKAVQTLFAAHFGFPEMHLVLTERELKKGYADLVLAPLTSRYPGNRYGYVLEFKVLKRRRKLSESAVAKAVAAAQAQLRRYLADPVLRREPSVRYLGVALVFHGWELVEAEAVKPPDSA